MGVSRELDKRYKVTLELIEKFKGLREKGISYRNIGEQYGLSAATVYYWLNDEHRKKRRKELSLRKHVNNRYRIDLKNKQNKMFTIEYALGYIQKRMNCVKPGETILGISPKHWRSYLKRNYHKGMRKLGI